MLFYKFLQSLSEEQSMRVRKRKYPHRMSRKGYVGLLEEEVRNFLSSVLEYFQSIFLSILIIPLILISKRKET